jgi:hypothetical protein
VETQGRNTLEAGASGKNGSLSNGTQGEGITFAEDGAGYYTISESLMAQTVFIFLQETELTISSQNLIKALFRPHPFRNQHRRFFVPRH